MLWQNTKRIAVCVLGLLPGGITPVHADVPFLPWFLAGEGATYRVYWGIVPVAETVITTEWIREGDRALVRIRLKTNTNRFMDKIHRVDDLVECIVDPTNFCPVRVTERVNEKSHTADETTIFDRTNRVAHWTSALTGQSKVYAIEPDSRDMVSMLYFMRSKAFKPGDKAKFAVAAYNAIYEVQVTAGETEQLSLPRWSRVPCTVLYPKAISAGLFKHKLPEKIWVSCDERHLITRIDAKVAVGTVHVVLSEVRGPGKDFWVDPAVPVPTANRDTEGK